MWDDPGIPPDEMLLRRIPRHPDFRVPDVLSGRLLIKKSALRYNPDGMSVQADSLLPVAGVARHEIYNWETHNGIEFPVDAARRTEQAGVVAEPDPDDERLGEAHASVRLRPDCADKKGDWDDVRAVIAEEARLMPEDPNPPE
ncbi:hypothetical protein SAMN05421671_4064 [Pimelobacter simplex]|nr:hypothetical protein SAMN05421671_4064 [Pimelobacter simplex]